jgi:hypothetical protein
MSALSTTEQSPAPASDFCEPIAQESVLGTWQGTVTVTRAVGRGRAERVFITDGDGQILLILTPTEAADLAEAAHNVSGMATSTYGARFLAEVYRENFARYRITMKRASEEAGIKSHRLRRLLRGEQPMTTAEHKALSEVGAR